MDYSYFNQGFEAPAYGLPGMDPTLSANCSLPAYGDLQRTTPAAPGQVGVSQHHYMYNTMRPFTSCTPSLPSSSCTMPGMMARPTADPRQPHMFPSSKSTYARRETTRNEH